MKNILFTNLLLLMMSVCLFAQSQEAAQHRSSCGHVHARNELYKKNPQAEQRAKMAQKAFAAHLKEKAASGEATSKSFMTKRIPVVFHVIYGDCGDGNIDRSRIDDAITQLNDDFKGDNAENLNLEYQSRVGSLDIDFFLAQKDPNGNPTTGITRTESDLTYAGVGFGPELRDIVMWPRDTFLNVYVVNQINSTGSSGVAIYPEDAETLSGWDGIAMADWAMGPLPGEDREHYNTIISHEVGHWLGLRHIWGDGNGVGSVSSCDIDDFDHLDDAQSQYVPGLDNPLPNFPESIYNDTPKTIGNSTFGDGDSCPEAGGSNTCEDYDYDTNGDGEYDAEDVDMLENIMDYTRCASMFSQGQVNYMNEVLEDTIADRNKIPENAASVSFTGNESLVVFQEATLNESKADNGAIADALNVQLVNTSFKTNIPNNLTEGTHYDITLPAGFNPGDLQVSVVKSSSNTATLTITNSITMNTDDIEFSIVFRDWIFNISVDEENRTKVIRVDFIESGTPVRNNQTYDLYVGPEDRWYGETYFKRAYAVGLGYEDGQYYVYTENPSVSIATVSSGNAKVFNEGDAVYNAYTFEDAIDDPYLALNVAAIPSGSEFYIGFRNGCAGSFNYGWVRAQKDPSCDRIKILENYIHSAVNQYVVAGQTDSPRATYQTFTMKESTSGTFSSIEIDLKGLAANYGFQSPIGTNDFNVAALEDEPIPTDFSASNLSISVVNNHKAIVTLATPPTLPIDFKFQLTFNQSAFINGTPAVDMSDTPIKVDYINIMGKAYNSFNVVTSEHLDAAGKNIAYSNNSYHPFSVQAFDGAIIQDASSSYAFFVNPEKYPFPANIACKTPGSYQVKLFSCGDNTNNLNFTQMGGGLTNSSTSITGETYVSQNDLSSWTEDYAYVMLRYDIGCGEFLTAWAKLDVSDYLNSVTLVETALSEDPNGIELCDKGPCLPIILDDEESRRMYIEEVILGGVQNISTRSSIGYEDHTNVVLPLQIGDNWINLTQGNGVSSENSAQFTPQNAHWYAFIDFNNNDHFDPEELVLSYEGQDYQGYLDEIPSNTAFGTYKMRVVISLYDLSDYAANFACNNPNNGHVNGETEDYTVTLSNTLNCTDTDNDGICFLNDCDDSNANLPTTPGTGCNDGNPTSMYDLIQDDGCTCKGTPTSVMGYCVPDVSSPSDSYISRVTLLGSGIDNPSGNDGGYRDYSVGASHGNVTKAETYTMNLHKESGFGDVFYWKVWIDYNQDGEFDDENEIALSQGAVSDDIFSDNITIPDNAVVGATAMRVYLKRYVGGTPTPCDNDQSSVEVEDYRINIADCIDADNDGTCAVNDCYDNDPTFPMIPGTPCNDGDAETDNDIIQEDGCTCKGSITPDATSCTPDIPTNSNGVYINSVTLEGINNPSGNEGYGDFTTTDPAYLSQSGEYLFRAYKLLDENSLFHWRVWIDYNEDGDFDETNELVVDMSNQSNYYIETDISIPANVSDGVKLMRIHLKEQTGNSPEPCGNDDGADAEIEDYTVIIGASTVCTDADNDGVCIENDCNDNDPALPMTPGTPCDDSNQSTDNDVILADGCTCQGTISSGYCVPNVTSSTNNYITGVVLGDEINYGSVNNGGYSDFTTIVAPGNIVPGETYNLNLYKALDNNANLYWRVWIDYNQNGVFGDNSNELIVSDWPISTNIFSNTFTVPTGTPNGTTRMRVYLKEYVGQPPVPCGNNDNVAADVEDYALIIGSGACTDADNDGVCAADDCNDNNSDLPATPGTPCNDGNSDTENDVILADGCTCQGTVIPPSPEEYCIPNVTSGTDNFISGIVIPNEISVGSGNDGGYKDFSSEVAPANLLPGDTYNLTLYKMLNNNANVYWRVWIDYNQNGVFGDNSNELIVSDWPVSTNIFSNNFTVPAGTPNGPTRMRVYMKEYVGQPPVPCGNNDNVAADVEDYAIIIGDGCSLFLEVSGTVNPGTFEAADYIESDGTVLSNNTVTFQAGNLVHLLPGFIATAGTNAQFHALIDDCPVSAPKQEIESTEQVTIRNYPNPFTGQTTIEFTLTQDSPVTLWVTDAMGRKVAVLKDGESTFAGTHEVYFDGSNHAPGMYYYTIQAGEYTGTQKMVLIK